MLEPVGGGDFLEVERDDVIAEVACEGDAVAVGDFAADAGLADCYGAVSRNQCKELVLPLDLEFVEPGQQGAEAHKNEGSQKVKPESEAGFHGEGLSASVPVCFRVERMVEEFRQTVQEPEDERGK